MSLNEKQKRFAAEYIIDLSATAAAKRAGYSEKTAHSNGSRLLKHDGVKAEIQKQLAKRSARTEISQDRVLKELASIAFFDIRKAVTFGGGSVELVPSDALDDSTAAAIREVAMTENGIRIKMSDKPQALTLLAKHLGMLAADDGKKDDAPPMNVVFNVAAPVGDVRVTKSQS